MKQFTSKNGIDWAEIVPVKLTEEQQVLLKNNQDSTELSDLKNLISTESRKDVSSDNAEILSNLYNQYKPELKENDIYNLISANINHGHYVNGLINCRVNGEHKQIRF